MITYIYEFFLAFVLSASRLVPEDYIVVPSVERQPRISRAIPASLPSLRISLPVWVEKRIAKGYVMFSLVLLGFSFLKFLWHQL